MKAEDFIELIEQNRFDKISKNGMTLIAERFRELQSKQLTLNSVNTRELPPWVRPLVTIITMSLVTVYVIYKTFYVC